MVQAQKITLSFPSSLQYLDTLQGVAEGLATVAGFGDEGRLDVGLAVREAVINAMKHGNQLDPQVPVKLTISIDNDKFKISVKDQGAGFVPEATPDPTAKNNLWRSSGRGLLLIRSLVDDVRHVRRKSGMEIVLTKWISPQQAGKASS